MGLKKFFTRTKWKTVFYESVTAEIGSIFGDWDEKGTIILRVDEYKDKYQCVFKEINGSERHISLEYIRGEFPNKINKIIKEYDIKL